MWFRVAWSGEYTVALVARCNSKGARFVMRWYHWCYKLAEQICSTFLMCFMQTFDFENASYQTKVADSWLLSCFAWFGYIKKKCMTQKRFTKLNLVKNYKHLSKDLMQPTWKILANQVISYSFDVIIGPSWYLIHTALLPMVTSAIALTLQT